MDGSLSGRVLVATPALTDPNFHRAVVLILEHNVEGAIGLVLNRPSDVRVADALPGWEDVAASPSVVFAGGPVERDAIIALGRAHPETIPGADWVPIVDHLRIVDLTAGPAVAVAAVADARIFVGYAGWSAGQLEAEVAEDAWFVAEARELDAVNHDPDSLWAAVLRRQPGELALFSTYPDDPSLN